MGQNQRRPGFLRWGEGSRSESAEATVDDAPEQAAAEQVADEQVADEQAAHLQAAHQQADAEVATPHEPASGPSPASEPSTVGAGATPFLRDLVGAMRGVAESSRDTTLAELRDSVEKRVEELGSGAANRAEELRRRSEQDLDGIGDWERAELERVRTEAEQRREARRAQLEKELADHQAGADAEVEATRSRLAQYEQELEAFFAKLSTINDPAAFVSAAKRMPPPPDLAASQASAASPAPVVASEPPAATAPESAAQPGPENASSDATEANDSTLAQRLAQLNQRLGSGPAAPEVAAPEVAVPGAETAPTTPSAPATPAAATATVAPPTPSTNGTAAEASTPIVVKGLGSFGAITSFKQALERVDGISGVTLSLGPTGDFVYRASHAPEFDLAAAIRSIEGQSAEITQVDGQLRVTIERPR